MIALTKPDIDKLFLRLNVGLKKENLTGELYLVGGAVLCLVHEHRASTKDVDALFKPATRIRQIAARLAHEYQLEENWLNDSVKGFLSPKGEFSPYLDMSNLKIFAAKPEYLLAMKCLAMRIGREFHDLDDVRYLLRYLNISKYKAALQVIQKYYPLEKFPQKTLYALEEILSPPVKKGD